MNPDLKVLFDEMRGIKNDLAAMKGTDTQPTPNPLLVDLEQRYVSFSSHVLEYLQKMSTRMDDLESYSRRNCLLVHGVPENPAEVCSNVLINLFAQKQVHKLDPRDIDRVHRLGKPKTASPNPRPIIVKFVGYGPRSAVFGNKKKMKGSGITITESLTKQRHGVLTAAREKFGATNVWSMDGVIVVLIAGQKHKLTTLEELELLEGDAAAAVVPTLVPAPAPAPTKPPANSTRSKTQNQCVKDKDK